MSQKFSTILHKEWHRLYELSYTSIYWYREGYKKFYSIMRHGNSQLSRKVQVPSICRKFDLSFGNTPAKHAAFLLVPCNTMQLYQSLTHPSGNVIYLQSCTIGTMYSYTMLHVQAHIHTQTHACTNTHVCVRAHAHTCVYYVSLRQSCK